MGITLSIYYYTVITIDVGGYSFSDDKPICWLLKAPTKLKLK
ncbi:hypothetical protein [Candidatus Nitrosocosmicus sp. T]